MLKKPKSVIFLIIIFVLSTLKSIELLARHKTVSDYQILQNYSAEYLFFIFGILLLTLNILTLWLLIKPKPIGFRVAATNLIVAAVNFLINSYFIFQDLNFAKKAYILSREARGMSINENSLNFLFTPPTAYLIIIFELIWLGFLFILLLKNKKYFTEPVYTKKNP